MVRAMTMGIALAGFACSREVPEAETRRPATVQEQAPPVVRPDVAPAPAPPPPAPPPSPDFAVWLGGGPVAAHFGADRTELEARLAPAETSGAFVMIETRIRYDSFGAPGRPRELRRVPVPLEDVTSLHALIHHRSAELQAPCENTSVMDGSTSAIHVRMGGAEHTFRCTNARTAAFTELEAAFERLRERILGPAQGLGQSPRPATGYGHRTSGRRPAMSGFCPAEV